MNEYVKGNLHMKFGTYCDYIWLVPTSLQIIKRQDLRRTQQYKLRVVQNI